MTSTTKINVEKVIEFTGAGERVRIGKNIVFPRDPLDPGKITDISYSPIPGVTIDISSNANTDTSSAVNSISIGNITGVLDQKEQSIAIGYFAGFGDQSNNAIAIGTTAGGLGQNPLSVAIGYVSGFQRQGPASIAIGNQAGVLDQSFSSIAIGDGAGFNAQGPNSIAIGTLAARGNQDPSGVIISSQGENAIAIGSAAGIFSQSENTIAIGREAGALLQGRNAVAIGPFAGQNNQHENTIILNARDISLNSDASNAFYVAPVREKTGNYLLQYDISNNEISYSNNLDLSGDLTLNCNDISGVNSITFCGGGTYIGPGGSFDISTNEVLHIKTSQNVLIDGDTTFNNNVEIGGNLTVRGTTTQVSTQQLFIKDNVIEINQTMDASGNVDPSGVLPNPNDFQSGFVVYRGPDPSDVLDPSAVRTPYQFLYDESSNTFQIGISGEMQPVATREDIPTDNGVAVWDASTNRFVTDRGVFVDISGNVGIGKSNPTVSLDISGNENITINSDSIYSSSGLDPYLSNSAIRIINANTDASGEGYASIYLQNRSGNVAMGLISLTGQHYATQPGQLPGALTFGLRPNTGGGTITERMRIRSDGTIVFGNGSTNSIPNSAILRSTDASGTDINGANLTIQSGSGTGTGIGGNITIRTSKAGISGSILNPVVDRIKIDSSNIILYDNLSMNDNLINDVSGIYFSDETYIGHGDSFDISTNEELKINSSSNILFNNQHLFINSSNGYVGVGTTDPSNILDINGGTIVRGRLNMEDKATGNLYSPLYNESGFTIIRSAPSTNKINLRSSDLSHLFATFDVSNTEINSQVISLNGNLSVRTNQVDVYKNLNLNCNLLNDVSGINFCDGTYIGSGSSFDICSNEVIKINEDDIVVDTSGTIFLAQQFRTSNINSRVVIGTTEPTGHKLTVDDPFIGYRIPVNIQNSHLTAHPYKSVGEVFSVITDVSGSDNVMGECGRILATGNGWANGDVNSRARSFNIDALKSGGLELRSNFNGAPISFSTTNTNSGGNPPERMRIDASGNVGIGTTNPSQKLSVNGNVDISGNLNLNCNLLNDVSGINFCDGTYIGQGNSFDISSNEVLHIKTSQNVLIDGDVSINDNLNVVETINTKFLNIRLQGVDTAEPLLKLERLNNAGGGLGNDEIGLDINIPSTYNNSGTVYGIKCYARHNLGNQHYGGYFETAGNAYSNGIALYAKTTHTDTNGPGFQPALLADANSIIGLANSGYAVAVQARTNNYVNNINLRLDSLYDGSLNQSVVLITRNNATVGRIRTNETSTSYLTSNSSGLIGIDANNISLNTNNNARLTINSAGNIEISNNLTLPNGTLFTKRIQEIQNQGIEFYVPFNSLTPRIIFNHGTTGSGFIIGVNKLTLSVDKAYDIGETNKYFNKAYIDNILTNKVGISGELIVDNNATFNSNVDISGELLLFNTDLSGNITTSTANHNADIKATSTGLETTKFLKVKINGADAWIPFFSSDPSL